MGGYIQRVRGNSKSQTSDGGMGPDRLRIFVFVEVLDIPRLDHTEDAREGERVRCDLPRYFFGDPVPHRAENSVRDRLIKLCFVVPRKILLVRLCQEELQVTTVSHWLQIRHVHSCC